MFGGGVSWFQNGNNGNENPIGMPNAKNFELRNDVTDQQCNGDSGCVTEMPGFQGEIGKKNFEIQFFLFWQKFGII